MFTVNTRNGKPCNDEDGAVSRGTRICGTYMHGLFDVSEIKYRWLDGIGIPMEQVRQSTDEEINATALSPVERKRKNYTLLKAHFEKYVDMEDLLKERNDAFKKQ